MFCYIDIIHNDDSQVEVLVSSPLLPAASRDYGSGDNTSATNTSVTNTLTPAGIPIQATDDKTVPTPSTCKTLDYYRKTIYITNSDDTEQWVSEILISFLVKLIVKVVRISDAIPGKPRLSARVDFINEANKTILVISQQSIKDKDFLYDISKVLHKDPDPTKIKIIPILYGNVAHSDIPKEIVHLTSIRTNDPEFVAKITRSIYS